MAKEMLRSAAPVGTDTFFSKITLQLTTPSEYRHKISLFDRFILYGLATLHGDFFCPLQTLWLFCFHIFCVHPCTPPSHLRNILLYTQGCW